MTKNLFSKFGVFLIAISLYCYILVFYTVSAKKIWYLSNKYHPSFEVYNQGKPE
ncbi:hypothetical protein T4C_12488 [Trichinella pseudospiralis]|uniref:Uncharacterized protein n=1 Tax=Trichinella pseudospiralis TaxID=6337 RepID=A0A0V1GIR5_TRIPS|nr:hypothetical protein T4C_12488 [Trichinella pseudospiralis]